MRGRTTIAARVPTPIETALQLTLARAAHSAAILGRKSAGRPVAAMPAKSFSWLVAMTMAMPMVKPFTTASGT